MHSDSSGVDHRFVLNLDLLWQKLGGIFDDIHDIVVDGAWPEFELGC